MTKRYEAEAGAGIMQAAPAPHRTDQASGIQVLADLPADPFARRPALRGRRRRRLSGPNSRRLSGLGSRRLSGRPAVLVLASLIVALLASSAAPTPLYAIYQAQWHFTPITTMVVFGVYAMAVLAALLTLGKLSDHVGRRPVLLTAIAGACRRPGREHTIDKSV